MNRRPLPDLTALLARWAVLVVAGLTAATLAGQAVASPPGVVTVLAAASSAILPALLLLVLAGCLLVLVELVRHDLPAWADAEELR